MGLGEDYHEGAAHRGDFEDTVKAVYEALRVTEKRMSNSYEYIHCILPEEITFVTSQELEDRFPDLSPREREYKIAKEKGAVFLMQIGGALASGEPHDGRAPDYDDWSLNGDIIVYYPVLDTALELSSMGIRVDEEALIKQLEIAGCPERAQLPFQKAIIEKQLPYTSAAVSDSPGSACSSCGKRTSERCRFPSGRRIRWSTPKAEA